MLSRLFPQTCGSTVVHVFDCCMIKVTLSCGVGDRSIREENGGIIINGNMFFVISLCVQNGEARNCNFIGHGRVFKFKRCDTPVQNDLAALLLQVINQWQHNAFKLIIAGPVNPD